MPMKAKAGRVWFNDEYWGAGRRLGKHKLEHAM
jgi:hypothetical protein